MELGNVFSLFFSSLNMLPSATGRGRTPWVQVNRSTSCADGFYCPTLMNASVGRDPAMHHVFDPVRSWVPDGEHAWRPFVRGSFLSLLSY